MTKPNDVIDFGPPDPEQEALAAAVSKCANGVSRARAAFIELCLQELGATAENAKEYELCSYADDPKCFEIKRGDVAVMRGRTPV